MICSLLASLRKSTLPLEGLPSDIGGQDRFSLIADDVERFHGTATNFPLALFDQGLARFFRLAVSSFILSLRGALTRDHRYIGQEFATDQYINLG